MLYWCLQFPPKNERKQVDLRYHSSKVEFVRSFFGRIVGLKKPLRLCLTFHWFTNNTSGVLSPTDLCSSFKDFFFQEFFSKAICLVKERINDPIRKGKRSFFVCWTPLWNVTINCCQFCLRKVPALQYSVQKGHQNVHYGNTGCRVFKREV